MRHQTQADLLRLSCCEIVPRPGTDPDSCARAFHGEGCQMIIDNIDGDLGLVLLFQILWGLYAVYTLSS